MEIKVLQDILSANEAIARNNRKLLDANGILAINIMSSPGAGKTSLILKTINKLKGKAQIAVIEGDVASTIDADKVQKAGIPVVQINTGGGCHLEANMISKALSSLSLKDTDLLLIENVGNLICPAGFALGEHKKVMLLSLPEGDDKPHKYPAMFTQADVVVLNKIDLRSLVDFDVAAFHQAVTGVNIKAKIFEISCKSGEGLEEWLSWLNDELALIRAKARK